MNSDAAPPRSVLVIQTGFLGDAVLATGMLRALHALGVARIGFAVRSDVAEIFERHPAITRLHVLDKRAAGSTSALIEDVRSEAYDCAITPHRSMRSTLIALRAGVQRRIGFRQSELALLHTDRVHYSIAAHELDRNAALIERMGLSVPVDARQSWLVADADATDHLRAEGYDDAVVIAPGSIWQTKRWTEDGFVEVATSLAQSGRRVLLSGNENDRDLCSRIADRAGLSRSEVLAGELSLRELVALLAMASRVVCNDSAPLHIAEAVGTPVTAMFGPTVPQFGFAPVLPGSSSLGIELSCRPCRIHGSERCPIGTHQCMLGIAPAAVLETIH